MRRRQLALPFRILKWRRAYKLKKYALMERHTRLEIQRSFHWLHKLSQSRVVTRERCRNAIAKMVEDGLLSTERILRLTLHKWRVKVTNGPMVVVLRRMRCTWALWHKALRAGRLYRLNLKRRVLHTYRELVKASIYGRKMFTLISTSARIRRLFCKRSANNGKRLAFTKLALNAGVKPHSHDSHAAHHALHHSRPVNERKAIPRSFQVIDVDHHLSRAKELSQVRERKAVQLDPFQESQHGRSRRQEEGVTAKIHISHESVEHHHTRTVHRNLHSQMQERLRKNRDKHK